MTVNPDLKVQVTFTLTSQSKYQHYKNKQYYQLIGKAKHTETKEEMAVYLALYEPYELFVRPWSMFFEMVDGVPRFKEI